MPWETPALVCIQYELQVHEGEVVAGLLVVSTMGARRRGFDRYLVPDSAHNPPAQIDFFQSCSE